MPALNHIREYSKDWLNGFAEIAQYLARYVPGECRIHHVGSTAIRDMPAKDVIDVNIECPQGSMRRVISGPLGEPLDRVVARGNRCEQFEVDCREEAGGRDEGAGEALQPDRIDPS